MSVRHQPSTGATWVRRASGPVVIAVMAWALAGCTASDAAPSDAVPTASAASLSEQPASPTPEPSFVDGVYAVMCDPASHQRASAVAVMGPETYGVGGWSHSTRVGSFESVALPVGEYRITAEHYTEQPDCSGAKALATVLVKKTYDWDRQHANGMEAAFPTEDLTFGDVGDIVLEVRVDAAVTSIPTAAALEAAYGDLLTPDQLAGLDGQQINLELTLFGQGATADQPFMNAGTIVAIDPAQFADGWVRAQVPREQLTFYTEDNYVRTEVGPDTHRELLVQGLRINPETAHGATVRRIVTESGGTFDPQGKPELFKEMGLTFSLIEVGRAD